MLKGLKPMLRKASDQIDKGWSQIWNCFRTSDAIVNAGAAVQAQIGKVRLAQPAPVGRLMTCFLQKSCPERGVGKLTSDEHCKKI